MRKSRGGGIEPPIETVEELSASWELARRVRSVLTVRLLLRETLPETVSEPLTTRGSSKLVEERETDWFATRTPLRQRKPSGMEEGQPRGEGEEITG